MTGKVIWFSKVKGYGFIARHGGPDVFVHYTAIVARGYRALAEGDAVEFEVVEGGQGPQASDVSCVRALRPAALSCAWHRRGYDANFFSS